MAAAIVPLTMEALPLIMPIVMDAIQGVEKIFHKIPQKTGTIKKSVVTQVVNLGLDTLVGSGIITTRPDSTAVNTMIENTFQVLNAQGLVNSNPAQPTTVTVTQSSGYSFSGTISLPKGSS